MYKSLMALILLAIPFAPLFSQSQNLGINDPAPEINLPNPQGDTVVLTSFRGKVVLIDFWASWCPPCVKEQPELVKLYKQYKNKTFTKGNGFEIYGVSLDSKKENWEKAIAKWKISWTQVSDLKFWSSPVARIYDLQEIPANFLIDSRGNIIAKDLHGHDLEESLKKMLVEGE